MTAQPAEHMPLPALLALAAIALAFSAKVVLIPALLVVVLLLYVFAGLHIPGKPRMLLALVMGAIFAAWWRVSTQGLPAHQNNDLNLMQVLGLYTVALGSYHLLSRKHGGNVEQAVASAIIGLAIAGTAEVNPAFDVILVLFIPVLLVYLRLALSMEQVALSRGHYLKHGLAVIALAGAAWTMQTFLVAQIPALTSWGYHKVITPNQLNATGFSRQANLHSIARIWRSGGEQDLVLRCWSGAAPGYLRAAVYDQYAGGVWSLIPEDQDLAPLLDDRGRNVFAWSTEEAQEVEGMVYPERAFSDGFFLPLGVQRISTFCDQVMVSSAWTVRSRQRRTAGGYGYYLPRGQPPPPSQADLQIPEELRPELERLARDLMPQGLTPQQCAAKLEEHFSRHYQYQLGVTTAPGADPVLDFLKNGRAGHCEYFAAASTLLLRARGIPARYSTGVVCLEPGLGQGFWIGRRKDAHAWTEMFVLGRGWSIVETTPAAGQPQPRALADAAWEQWFSAYLQRIGGIIRFGGVKAIIANIWDAIVNLLSWIPIWIWVAIIVGGLVWVFRSEMRLMITRQKTQPVTQRIRALQRKLTQAQKLAARHGLYRNHAAPVGELISRVQQATIPEPEKEQILSLLDEYQQQRFCKDQA